MNRISILFIIISFLILSSAAGAVAQEIDLKTLAKLCEKAEAMEIEVYFKDGGKIKGKPSWDGKCIRLQTRNVIGDWMDSGCLDSGKIARIVIKKESTPSHLKPLVLVACGFLLLSFFQIF